MARIREETQKDEVMQRLAKRIAKGDWEKHKRDKDIEPYSHLKQKRLIFREQRIILPAVTQRKVSCQDRTQPRKLRQTKTKQLLREKYWFPLMDSMIDTAVKQTKKNKYSTPFRWSSILHRV